jgi:hypothetical protein
MHGPEGQGLEDQEIESPLGQIELAAHGFFPSPSGCRVDGIELREDDPAPLTRFFSATGYSQTLTKGVRGMVITLTCRKGKVTFATMI